MVRRYYIHHSPSNEIPLDKRGIYIVHVDQQIAQECYVAGLKVALYQPLKKVRRLKMAMADLDPITNTDDSLDV